MYTSTAKIVDTEHFTLYSHGNGAAYSLKRIGWDENLMFQGDDAETFRNHWQALEDADHDRSLDSIMRELWNEYVPY